MSQLLSRIGTAAARGPWRVVVAFVLVLLTLGGVAGAVGAGFSDEVRLGDTGSQRAADLLAERFPAAAGDTATLVFHVDRGGVAAGPGTAVRTVLEAVAGQPDVASVTPLQVSPNGTTAFADVLYTKRASDLTAEHLHRLEQAVRPVNGQGVEASMRGPVVDRWRDRPVPAGEVVGLVAALVLVTLLFRSFVATLVTVGPALLGLAVGNAALAVVSGFIDVPTVAPTIAVMLGLGAGVDYALFLVAAFRARLKAGVDVVTAATRANGTTGTAVITAGAIVVVSICGLYVTGITIIGRMGMAAAIVVTAAALTTVTLVPALLRIAGERVLPRSQRPSSLPAKSGPAASDATPRPRTAADGHEGRRAAAVATAVARRPVLTAVASVTVLLALATPALDLELGQPDDSNRPVGDTMRTAYDRLTEGFGPGFNAPLLVALDLSRAGDPPTAVQRVREALTTTSGITTVTPPQFNSRGDTAVLTAIPATAPQNAATSRLVDELRGSLLPAALAGTGGIGYVGGQTATFDDLATAVSDSLGLLILVVVGLSLVLLAVAFRSLVLPVVSAILNLLSIAAAYGVVTLAFQTTTGTVLLGVAEQPVVSFVPMLMFAILFGLSMDYNVFLLSAVRDERELVHSARAAVPLGVGRTATLISTAGAIMTLVFLGFTLTSETEVKMIGLGLATAVLVDVTIVRLLLAPAILELLGETAWWMPTMSTRRLSGGGLTAHQ